jgi:hypothetical protein
MAIAMSMAALRSSTSLGLIANGGVDEVSVLAPMASTETGRPLKTLAWKIPAQALNEIRWQ